MSETRPAPEGAPFPVLARLRRGAPLVGLGAVLGGIAALGASFLAPTRYRASVTVLVEPGTANQSGVDYNLTPIRSYTALLRSPALEAACPGIAPKVSVRMPENTRLLEVSVDDADPKGAADVANCLVAKAIEENAKMKRAAADRTLGRLDAAVAAARAETSRRENDVAALRQKETLELKKTQLRAALTDVRELADAERTGRLSGRGSVPEIVRLRAETEKRAALLEKEVADIEERGDAARRLLDVATASQSEITRRAEHMRIDAEGRSFDLVPFGSAVPPKRPVSPSRLFAGLLGVAFGGGLAALLVLSRPE